MMTVKYVDKNGEESVFPVYGVRYNERCAAPVEAGCAPARGHVIFDRPKAYSDTPLMEHAYDGIVYVMNDNGKTVAKYDLGGQNLQGLAAVRVTSVTIDPAAYSGTQYTSPHTT